MVLHTDLKEQMKKALKAREAVRLSVIRNILTACTNELVSKKKTPQDILDDDGVLVVIKRLAKQRQDSIEQFEKGGRDDLASQEKEELVVLETYLPAMMSLEDITIITEAKIKELGFSDKAKMGQLIGLLMKELGGTADGKDVKTAVESLLS